MIQAVRDLLVEWNAGRSERVKLQHAYVVISLLGIVVAGLVGLLNYDASRTILRVCFAGLGIFAINAVAWALLSSLVLSRLSAKRAATPRK
jgi:hypothetical protein